MLDVAGELGEQLRARLEVCQLLGALGIVDSAVSGGTLDDKSLVVLGEVTDDLRSLDEVALHEGDGGRAGEISSRPSMPASLAAMRASVFFATV